MVKDRKGHILNKDPGYLQCITGVEDWDKVGMTRRVWKALQESPELGYLQDGRLEARKPA